MEVTAAAKKNGKQIESTATISPPNFQIAKFRVRDTAPYVQHKFSTGVKDEIRRKQEAGSTSKKGSKREPKDFQQLYNNATHFSDDGWCGIPAPGIRSSLISACKVVGFHMTKGKLALFVQADGFDADDGTPLVRIVKGERRYHETHVRISGTTTDIRARPMWAPGWEADLHIKFDADMFTGDDVANLVHRAGVQVGWGEGRPDSKTSNGQGWGTFEIVTNPQEA